MPDDDLEKIADSVYGPVEHSIQDAKLSRVRVKNGKLFRAKPIPKWKNQLRAHGVASRKRDALRD